METAKKESSKTEGLCDWLKERDFTDAEVSQVCATAATVEDLLLATRDERAAMMRDWKSQPRQRLEREIAIATGLAQQAGRIQGAPATRDGRPTQPCCVCGCDDEEESLLRCAGLNGHCNATAHALCVGFKKANSTWYCAACRDAQDTKRDDEPRRSLVVHATAARGRAPSSYAGSISATVDPASLSRESCDAWGPEDYDTLKNFPRARGPRRNCVMCGRAAPEQCSIPKQNKDVCDACSKAFWRHLPTTTCFKWCKGCKRFRSLPAFATKLVASKCDACRERGREGYQRSKQKLLEGQ
ncbi:hypothetical protein M885DRAFT_47927 [Pelagophyceae sp. CCMP2097]|nr:hypothetical protein M885DRAFT_47927 [Pelagophyceae sp. CCMP2097]